MSECLMIFYKFNFFFMENKIKSLGVVLTRSKLKQVNGGIDKPCCYFVISLVGWFACCSNVINDRACCKSK